MITYRIMTIDDYDAVYDLWMHTPGMGLNAVDDSREGIEAYLRRNPTSSFVAECEAGIVGVIMAGHDGRRGYIYHTAVLPIHRKQGIATTLVDHALAALEKEGIKKVALLVFKENELGNQFWEATGFSERSDIAYRNKFIQMMEKIEIKAE